MAADRFRLAWGAGFALFGLAFASSAVAEKPARLQPTRIASIGDSITRAFDSNLILDNPSESWVNGYYGVTEFLLGYENINSHNQRADAAFGVSSNVNGAANGADMDDMAGQAAAILGSSPYYVVIELGGNDICKDEISQVTTPLDYILQYIDGVVVLDPELTGGAGGLTPGSSVYTVSVPDVKQLYDVGKDETGALGIDCEVLWAGTAIGFPCGSMLSPDNTEADRLALQAINVHYNLLLELISDLVNMYSPSLYWDYTWSVWGYQIQPDDISSIDCFHPSSDGQEVFSFRSWAGGPFAAF